jgi:hypothetical protein
MGRVLSYPTGLEEMARLAQREGRILMPKDFPNDCFPKFVYAALIIVILWKVFK